MLTPFQQAVLRIAQGHYRGRPKSTWLQRLQQYPEMQNTTGQRLTQGLGFGTPGQIATMTPSNIGTYR